MQKKSKLLVSFLVVLGLSALIFSATEIFAQTYPETVRVGLYFGDTPAANVSFTAKSGLEIGYYKDGAFIILLKEEGGKQTIVRKDSHFIRSPSGVVSEYNPNEGIPFDGETFGPYHIQIGDAASDLKTAQSLCNTIRSSGIVAYPVFENGWYVWTGFYSDAVKANSELQTLANKLSGSNLKVIEPSASRMIIYDSGFEPHMIFGAADVKLVIRPNEANDPRVISVNSKQYRGEIELRRFSGSDMTVINIVDLEQYLYGVVPKEIESYAPMEALKAQAVAARTFTYRSMGSYKKWDFDVVNTVASQVYGGYDAEKATTNQAVDETKGKKVLYNGRLASMHYFSSSGGMTEDNIYVWGSDVPYLKSVPDPYEAENSYNYNWSRTFTAEDIKMKLFISGVEIGDIIDMTADEYTPAGRVRKLRIVGTSGSITYTNEDIRIILGDSGYLPSRMFTINSGSAGSGGTASVITDSGTSSVNVFGARAVTSSGTYDITAGGSAIKVLGASDSAMITGNVPKGTYVLTGKGWGHGIGMSQEGAKGFARNGYTYDQILKHYFTGVTVE
ncbi:MAG: SpoIID/LytB domain-containing protein [Clostridiaceae bacterium]|jgi:stage II sporulation protein D|nr:SpoIID/LytB domain-containing protein [Clostridiaceae bacterium]